MTYIPKTLTIIPVQNGYIAQVDRSDHDRHLESSYASRSVFNTETDLSEFVRDFYQDERVKEIQENE